MSRKSALWRQDEMRPQLNQEVFQPLFQLERDRREIRILGVYFPKLIIQ